MDLFIVIPARGGSKGIPNKNLRLINGKSLVLHSLISAVYLKDRYQNDCTICLSSDSDLILNEANFISGHVIALKREVSLAEDNSLTLDVVIDAAQKCNIKNNSIILLLQPTVPFRPDQELAELLEKLELLQKGFKSIVSLKNVEGNHPFRFKRVLTDGTCISYIDQGFEDMRPRQELPPCYIRSGSYYASSFRDILESNSLLPAPSFGYIHKNISPINIDTMVDLYLAEQQIIENA